MEELVQGLRETDISERVSPLSLLLGTETENEAAAEEAAPGWGESKRRRGRAEVLRREICVLEEEIREKNIRRDVLLRELHELES
jgi:hypothetical protein